MQCPRHFISANTFNTHIFPQSCFAHLPLTLDPASGLFLTSPLTNVAMTKKWVSLRPQEIQEHQDNLRR